MNRRTGVARTVFCCTTSRKAEAVLQKASALSGELVNKDELNKAGSRLEVGEGDDSKIVGRDSASGGGT